MRDDQTNKGSEKDDLYAVNQASSILKKKDRLRLIELPDNDEPKKPGSRACTAEDATAGLINWL